MPSIASHMAVASLVNKELNINKIEFFKGNLLPDIIDKEDSHKRIKGTYYCIPDIDYFIKYLDLSNPLYLGYLSHLLLDKYYLEEYIPYYDKDKNVFATKKIYSDYNIMNESILNRYNLDKTQLKSILTNYDVKLNEIRYQVNLSLLDESHDINKLKIINFQSFCTFLDDSSKRIIKKVKEI